MIIALYGKSSSGKTTIANALRLRLENCPVRHCGEIVKARAKDLRVALGDLQDDEHRIIDAATRCWVGDRVGLAIVEGRYLNSVLPQAHCDVRLIAIVCGDAIREERWATRMGRALTPNELNQMDSEDGEFTMRLYGDGQSLAPMLAVDTTASSVEACVQMIVDRLQLPKLPLSES